MRTASLADCRTLIRRRTRRRFAVAAASLAAGLALAATATTLPPARSAPATRIDGDGGTGIVFVNLDREQSATTMGAYYDCHRPPSTPPVTLPRMNIPPLTGVNLFLPVDTRPRPGCGARITGDRPMAALVRSDWAASGATSFYHAVRPATEVVVPYFVKRGTGDNVGLAVMIDGDAGADVELTLYDATGTVALQTRYAFTAHEARLLPLHETPSVPLGFVGWARLRSTAPLGAVGIIDGLAGHYAAAAFEGVASASLATTLHAPLVRWSNHPQRTSLTTTWLVNPSDRAVRVTAHYSGLAAPCAGRTFTDAPGTIAPHAMGRFDPRAGGLPVNCAAALTLEADGPVAAAVVDSIDGGTFEAAYTALGRADAARTVLLPLMRFQHTAMKYTTAIAVHNPSAVSASVALTMFDDKHQPLPACDGCRVTLPPGGAHLFASSYARPLLPSNTFGSARIESDAPVVAVVIENSESQAADASIHAGIPVPDAPASGPLLVPYTPRGANETWRPPVGKRYFPWGDATRP